MSEETEYKSVHDIMRVDNELLENISALAKDQASENLITIFKTLHPADIAEIINRLEYDEAEYIFNLLDTESAGEVILELDENLREKILKEIEPEKITVIVDELDLDDATDIVSDLPEDVAEHVLNNIDREDSEEVKQLLKYREDSAGGLMNSDFVYVLDTAKISDAIEEVRKNSEDIDNIYVIYVLDQDDILLGFIQLKSLLIHPLNTPIAEIMEQELISVKYDEDQEEVAGTMKKYDLVSIPVIDENGKMLGRITIDDVVDVIHEEASEDIQIMAGLSEEEEVSDSPFRISRIRLPWLFVALIGELISAHVLSSFEASIQKIVIASFFIPIVMAMGGSSGTQAAIVMVRAMGTRDIWLSEAWRKLLKEFRVALLNGLVCAMLLMAATHFIFHAEFLFSVVLSTSLIIIMIFATMVGAAVPVVLKQIGIDPAIATGPFVSTTNDIFGLLIYLSLITIFFVS